MTLFIFSINDWSAQTNNANYLEKKRSKENFDATRWSNAKRSMLKEARGDANAKGESFSKKDFQQNKQEESYYKYKEETYEGEYARNNGEFETPFGPFSNEKYTTNESDYSYNDSKKRDLKKGTYYSKKENNNYSFNERKNYDDSNSKNKRIGSFGTIILYATLAIFLGLVVYYLFVHTNLSDKGKKVNTNETEVAPSEISKTELELMLEKALSEQNFRLAIRIYFIFILKELSNKKWITWKKDKTNYHYLTEMRTKKLFPLFNESVRIYELVWYGDYSINEEDYSTLEPKLKAFLNALEQE